jgi:flagellar biosynthesis protein FlhG
MKRMDHTDMNPYETLEIDPGASRREIDSAYALARLTYGDDSPATYSLYSPAERTAMLERVEQAYRMLTDPAAEATIEPAREEADLSTKPEPVRGRGPGASRPVRKGYRPISREVVEPTDIPGPYDGPTLKKIRESRGVELEEVACRTKISLVNLRLLESNAYERLPAQVYVRGFLAEYARCLRLDAQTVVRSYLEVAENN